MLNAAPSNSGTNPADLFRQAVETFQSAIKTGVKIQEESARRFTEMFRDFGSPMEWQKNAQAMVNEAITAAQRNIDESIRLMNHNAQMAMSLLEKAFECARLRPARRTSIPARSCGNRRSRPCAPTRR